MSITEPVSAFLEAMFGSKNPQSGYILIWRSDNKRSTWFKTASEAAASITADDVNVFVSAGISPTDYGPSKRCLQHNVMALAGFNVDIDVKGPGHKQTSLPKTFEEAYEILNEFPLQPSIVINSGGGLQAWWLFQKPWLLTDKATRKNAIELATRLNYTFKSYTKHTIDSTFDLSRCMRVPGTGNLKAERGPTPIEVKIEQMNGVRWSPVQIDGACIKVADLPDNTKAKAKNACVGDEGPKAGEQGYLKLGYDLKPAPLLFAALIESDAKFASTWFKQRDKTEKYPEGLGSASEYDLSLASFAHNAGWPDQEIVNLITAWRVKHKDDPNVDHTKVMRYKYMQGTLDIVKKKSDIINADRVIEDTENAGIFRVYSEADRELAAKTFRQKTGLPLTKIVQLTGDKASFLWMLGSLGEVKCTTKQHLYFSQWFEQVYEQTLERARLMKQREWLSLLGVIRSLIEPYSEESPLDRHRTQVADFIRDYLNQAQRLDVGLAIYKREPFKRESSDHWFIFAASFRRWMKRELEERHPAQWYSEGYKMLGMKGKSESGRYKGKVISQYYFKVPLEIYSGDGTTEWNGTDEIDEIDESEQEMTKIIEFKSK